MSSRKSKHSSDYSESKPNIASSPNSSSKQNVSYSPNSKGENVNDSRRSGRSQSRSYYSSEYSYQDSPHSHHLHHSHSKSQANNHTHSHGHSHSSHKNDSVHSIDSQVLSKNENGSYYSRSYSVFSEDLSANGSENSSKSGSTAKDTSFSYSTYSSTNGSLESSNMNTGSVRTEYMSQTGTETRVPMHVMKTRSGKRVLGPKKGKEIDPPTFGSEDPHYRAPGLPPRTKFDRYAQEIDMPSVDPISNTKVLGDLDLKVNHAVPFKDDKRYNCVRKKPTKEKEPSLSNFPENFRVHIPANSRFLGDLDATTIDDRSTIETVTEDSTIDSYRTIVSRYGGDYVPSFSSRKEKKKDKFTPTEREAIMQQLEDMNREKEEARQKRQHMEDEEEEFLDGEPMHKLLEKNRYAFLPRKYRVGNRNPGPSYYADSTVGWQTTDSYASIAPEMYRDTMTQDTLTFAKYQPPPSRKYLKPIHDQDYYQPPEQKENIQQPPPLETTYNTYGQTYNTGYTAPTQLSPIRPINDGLYGNQAYQQKFSSEDTFNDNEMAKRPKSKKSSRRSSNIDEEYVYVIDESDPKRRRAKKVPRRHARDDEIVEVEYVYEYDSEDPSGRRKKRVPVRKGAAPDDYNERNRKRRSRRGTGNDEPDITEEYVYVIDESDPKRRRAKKVPRRHAKDDEIVEVEYVYEYDSEDPSGRRKKRVPVRKGAAPEVVYMNKHIVQNKDERQPRKPVQNDKAKKAEKKPAPKKKQDTKDDYSYYYPYEEEDEEEDDDEEEEEEEIQIEEYSDSTDDGKRRGKKKPKKIIIIEEEDEEEEPDEEIIENIYEYED